MVSSSGPASHAELAAKDRLGDRVHLILACTTLAVLPVNGAVAGILLVPLLIWALIRTAFWTRYLPSAPKVVMIPAVVWIGFLAVSMIWSPDQRMAGLKLWQQWPVVLVPVLWPILSHWRILLGAILVGSLVQASIHSIAILTIGFDRDTFGYGGLGEHPRRLAVWYAATAVGVVALFLSGSLRRWTWLLAVLVLTIPILLSYSRAALIALILGIGVVVLLALIRQGAARRTVFAAIACGLVVGGGLLASGERITDGLGLAWARTIQTVSNEQPEDIRLAWWQSSLRQWENRPVLGFGLGGSREALEADPKYQEVLARNPRLAEVSQGWGHPHSTYFQILLEGGIVGVALFTWLLGTIGYAAYRTSASHPIGVLAFGVLIVWMVTAATDEWYLVGHLLSLLWIAAVLAPFVPRSRQESGSTSPSTES